MTPQNHPLDSLKTQKKGALQKRQIEPGDELLTKMAMDAKILIPMPVGPGVGGLLQIHKWFRDNGIKYQQGAQSGGGNRALFGVGRDRRYAVQTQTVNHYFLAGPIEMDCTTYVNFMLAIYIQGHIHGAPYDASCKAYGEGSDNHCARDRYGLPLVCRVEGHAPARKQLNFFKTADQIVQATQNSGGRLFVLEVGRVKKRDDEHPAGGVTHMALCLNGKVYECTTHQPRSACIDRSIAEFMANKRDNIIYLFGPR